MTSRTVVFRIGLACIDDPSVSQTRGLPQTDRGIEQRTLAMESFVNGVYEVERKWHLGVGTSEAIMPTRSLFM